MSNLTRKNPWKPKNTRRIVDFENLKTRGFYNLENFEDIETLKIKNLKSGKPKDLKKKRTVLIIV